MAVDGDGDARIPTDFNECVSREELESANKLMLEKMDETVNKSVHDAIIAMELGKTYERLDRRLSDIVDKLAALETRCWCLPTSPAMTPADANLGWQYFKNHK